MVASSPKPPFLAKTKTTLPCQDPRVVASHAKLKLVAQFLTFSAVMEQSLTSAVDNERPTCRTFDFKDCQRVNLNVVQFFLDACSLLRVDFKLFLFSRVGLFNS